MLNEVLRLIREFHDLNQAELAKRLALSRSFISEIESGRKSPTLDLLDKYSREFNIPKSSLLLFSETLQDGSFREVLRHRLAGKALRLMKWISAKKDDETDEEE